SGPDLRRPESALPARGTPCCPDVPQSALPAVSGGTEVATPPYLSIYRKPFGGAKVRTLILHGRRRLTHARYAEDAGRWGHAVDAAVGDRRRPGHPRCTTHRGRGEGGVPFRARRAHRQSGGRGHLPGGERGAA